jgi:hypothetical protein
MSLKERIITDAVNVFLNENQFAEEVTYYPLRFGNPTTASPRSILAVVTRNQVAAFNPDEQIVPEFEVRVANNSTTGISSDEINTGGDFIKLPTRVGETPQRRSVQLVTEHDEGMLVLICR